MAYPDYSIVIISVTTNGVTNDYAQAFFNDELAKKYYNQAISEGKRAFYFEKPRPTRFVRNDSQPLKANTEKGDENQPLPATQQEQEDGTFLKDVFRMTVAGYMYYDAYNDFKELQSFSRKVGEETWTKWIGFLGLAKTTLTGTEWSLYGTVAVQITESNKRFTIRHDGSGGFLTPTIEKLWPNKDEITWTPALDQPATQVLIEILNEPAVALGTKRNKKVHDGTPQGGVVSEEYVWVPAGFIILETETHIYRSDGNGWYTATEKAHSSCDPAGTVISSVFVQDLMYPIVIDSGLSHYAQIGYQYAKDIADGSCGTDLTTVDEWMPNGTIVYETESTYYKSNGAGSVYEEAKNTGGGGDGGDNGGGGEPPSCPPQGTIVSTDYEALPNVSENWEGSPFSYSQGWSVVNHIADGTCLTNASEPTIEYNEEGLFLGTHYANSQDWVATAGPNGSVTFQSSGNEAESDVGDEGLDEPTTTPDIDFPNGSDCIDPPPANYGDGLTTSVLKSHPNGNIIGTQSKREIVVTLPDGYYNTGTMGIGGAMPSNTKTFTTGTKWSGRFIADGNCGWVPEDMSPSNSRWWTFPQGTSFPAGDYTNLVTVSTSGGSGTWTIWKDEGLQKNNAGRKFTSQRCGFRSDGYGNVTCYFK